MKTKYLTLAQCERIIANNYLGEPSKSGRQIDYGDFAIEINARRNELMDRKIMSSQFNKADYPCEVDSKVSNELNEAIIDISQLVTRTFNKWRYLGVICSG